MQNEEILLQVSHLNREFQVGKQTLHAVTDVNFSLKRGELLGIVGESGCGKSTLARMLTGSIRATKGSMILGNREYSNIRGRERREFRRNIQMVFQDPLSSFSPRMRIGTYLCEPRCNYDHIPRKEAMKEAETLLEKVGLPGEFVHRYPHELSGGQLQRVAIARAIAIEPDLLVCDEATGALDVSIQNQIARLLVDLVEEKNIGCIFIGHDLAFVRSITQRIAIMYLGRIVEILPSETLESDCRHPYTKALLDSVFDVYGDPTQEIRLLKGEPPSPMEMAQGCAFAKRCPNASERCFASRPELMDIEEGHQLACFCQVI